MTFAEKLRELRSAASLTQEALADASGIPLWTVRNYEQGRREPNWKAAIQLARGLGVTVEAFAECISEDNGQAAGESLAPKARTKKPRGRAKKDK